MTSLESCRNGNSPEHRTLVCYFSAPRQLRGRWYHCPAFRFAEQDFAALFRCHRLEIRRGRRWRALGILNKKIVNFVSAVCRGLIMRLIQPKIRPRRRDVSCWNLTLSSLFLLVWMTWETRQRRILNWVLLCKWRTSRLQKWNRGTAPKTVRST